MRKISIYRILASVVVMVAIILVVIALLTKAGIPVLPDWICENYGFIGKTTYPETKWECPFGCVTFGGSADLPPNAVIGMRMPQPKCTGW